MRIKFIQDDGHDWDISLIEILTEEMVTINRQHLGYSEMQPYEPDIRPCESKLLEEVLAAWRRYEAAEVLEDIKWGKDIKWGMEEDGD